MLQDVNDREWLKRFATIGVLASYLVPLSFLAPIGCGDQTQNEYVGIRRQPVALTHAPTVTIHLFGSIERITGLTWNKKGDELANQTAFSGPSQVTVRMEGVEDASIKVVGGLLTQRSGELLEAQLYLVGSPLSIEESLPILRDIALRFKMSEVAQVKEYFKRIAEEQPKPTGSVRLVNVPWGHSGLLSFGIRPAPNEDGWYPQACLMPASYLPGK